MRSRGSLPPLVVMLALLLVLAVAGPAAAGGGEVGLTVDAAIERVDTDATPPFIPPEPGDGVFVRVRVRSLGPDVARRGELVLVLQATAAMTVRGQRGWRCQVAGRGTPVRCVNSLVIRQTLRRADATSVLVRLPATGERVRVFAEVGAGPSARGRLRARRDTDAAAIRVLDIAGSWTGAWSWQAVLRGTGRAFTSPTPVLIRQEGRTVCALWSFSGGGSAIGTVSGSTWTARFQDGYGTGTWTLELEVRGVSGVQQVTTRAGGQRETYDIAATRTSSSAGALRCADITVP